MCLFVSVLWHLISNDVRTYLARYAVHAQSCGVNSAVASAHHQLTLSGSVLFVEVITAQRGSSKMCYVEACHSEKCNMLTLSAE